MGALFRHFMTVCKHKFIVGRECIACGQIWRGLMHDNSKFSIPEFFASAKHFQGHRSPIEAEKEQIGYSKAWLHHKGRNPHHWEYWTDFISDGRLVVAQIPYEYVVEMVCDWIGAGKVYKRGKWKQSDPYDYYKKVREGRHFHGVTEKLILKFLRCIRDEGLEEFHKMARCRGEYRNLARDYARRVVVI